MSQSSIDSTTGGFRGRAGRLFVPELAVLLGVGLPGLVDGWHDIELAFQLIARQAIGGHDLAGDGCFLLDQFTAARRQASANTSVDCQIVQQRIINFGSCHLRHCPAPTNQAPGVRVLQQL